MPNYAPLLSNGTTSGIVVGSGQTTSLTTAETDGAIVHSGGDLIVGASGRADWSTVQGQMVISSGGLASSTTVDYLGEVFISAGGTAVETLVTQGGFLQMLGGTRAVF